MKQMNLKKVLHIMYGLAAVYIALFLLGAALKSILVIILGLLVAIAFIVFNLAKWRCPYCGAHLGRGQILLSLRASFGGLGVTGRELWTL